MRDKILTLMSLTLTPHEHNVASIVGNLRAQLLQVAGEHEEACPAKLDGECVCERQLPKEAAEAIITMGDALSAGRGELEDMIVPLYEGVLTEEEIDATIAFNQGPVGHKLREVTPKLMEAIGMASAAWSSKIIEGLNEKLSVLFGNTAEMPVEINPDMEIPEFADLGEMPGAASDEVPIVVCHCSTPDQHDAAAARGECRATPVVMTQPTPSA